MKTQKKNAVRILTFCWLAFAASSMAGESVGVGADDALDRLLNGDKRFVSGKSEEPHDRPIDFFNCGVVILFLIFLVDC